MRLTRFSLGVLTVAMVLVGCAPTGGRTGSSAGSTEATQRTATPKKLTAAIRGDPRTLSDPINFATGGSSSAGVREIEQLLHAGLGYFDGQFVLRPQLAENVPTLENGLWKLVPGGRMETTWTLKPNALWHDGTTVTAQDLAFTAAVAQDRTQAISLDEAYQFVEALDVVDPRTVTVRWSGPFIFADRLFTQTLNTRILPMPRHLLEPTYVEDRANFTQSPYFGPEYVGTGPFRLKQWIFGANLVMEANDQYILGRPKIDQIEVRFILDTNTMVANLLAGALDLTLGRGLTPEQAILVRDQWREGKVVAGLDNTTFLLAQFTNPEPAILLDLRMRRALFHALDRQEMVDTFLAGIVPIAHSMVTPDQPEYQEVDRAIVKYAYDPRRSMEILDGMGLSKGPDGFYRDGAGQRMSFEVRSRAHALREKLQPVIVDSWGRIGIAGEPAVVPEQRIGDRAYQATFPGFYFRFGNPLTFRDIKSNRAALPENNFVGNNPGRYRNPEFDAMIDRFFSTIPPAERVQALAQVEHHMTDQLIFMTLFHEPEPILVSNRLVNVGGKKGDGIQAWNAEQWDVKS